MIIGVTGHRPQELGSGWNDHITHQYVKNKIDRFVSRIAKQHKDLLAITGMALGTDQWFAQSCINHKVPFVAAVPYKKQAAKWSIDCKKNYYLLLKQSEKIIYIDREIGYINPLHKPDEYHRDKHKTRNTFILDVLSKSPGNNFLLVITAPTDTEIWRKSSSRNIMLIADATGIERQHIQIPFIKL